MYLQNVEWIELYLELENQISFVKRWTTNQTKIVLN